MLYVYLAIGGVAGTLARHGVATWAQPWVGATFPWATFLVNLSGSFLLGLIVTMADLTQLSTETRTMLTVGFCGAFTTFSTFTYETVVLVQQGQWLRAILYAVGSLALGIAALALGLYVASLFTSTG